MGGNMMAESGMNSNIAQRGMTTLTDERYTQMADAGAIDFIGDSVGYGLCQWTLKSRKRHLFEYANNLKKSVGDESLQVSFCLVELLTDFPTLDEYLKTATDLYEATSRICKEYERPAVNNIEKRYYHTYQMYTDYVAILEQITKETLSVDAVATPQTGEQGVMSVVRQGNHMPEAAYLKALLEELGYDVLWEGLNNCLKDFQRRRGLTVDGICGEKTWKELMK